MKPAQLELLPSSNLVETHTGADFFALCQRSKAGEFSILSVTVLGPGPHYRLMLSRNAALQASEHRRRDETPQPGPARPVLGQAGG